MNHFSEDQINRLKHFTEKYGLGQVELEESDDLLELPVCGMSIAFETEVFSNKSLRGTTLSDGYVVYETYHSYSQIWGEDDDISEVGVYATFDQAVVALLTRAYENKVYYEVLEHDIHKAYEDNLEDIL